VVGDVAVTTLSGVAVGDAALDVRDQHPDATTGDSLRFLLLDRTTIGTLDGSDLVYGVGVVAEDETTITSIRVPSVNWGV
jgi:hypothetical protein